MTKVSASVHLLFLLVAILLYTKSPCLAALSDKQLCYDPNCSEVVSLAKTILAYRANDREVMSFDVNVDVKVFSKGAGKRTDLWGVEMNGKRGFAPKSFLNEYKVLQRDLLHEVPVYKFVDEAEKIQAGEKGSMEKIHKARLLDKLPHGDDDALPLPAKFADEDVQSEKVETGKVESMEEMHEAHPPLRDMSSHNDNEASSASMEFVDRTVQEFKAISADGVASFYEVIDGTTFYLEDNSSVQPSLVIESVRATTLPKEQILSSHTDLEAESGSDGDKATFINAEVLQSDTNDIEKKLKDVELSMDIRKETSAQMTLQSSKAAIGTVIGATSKDIGVSLADESDTSESEPKPSGKLQGDTMPIGSAKQSAKHNNNERVTTENTKDQGIFSSLAKTFSILSESQEVVETESAARRQRDDDDEGMPAREVIAMNDSPLQEQISDNVNVKDTANIQSTQTLLYSNIEVGNVPSTLDNFLHKDPKKSANDLPTASSSDSFTSVIGSSVENVEMQRATKEKKVTRNIEAGESVTLSNKQEAVVASSTTTRNSDEQSSRESDEMHFEDERENAGQKETNVARTGEIPVVDKIPGTSSASSLKKTVENITEEAIDSSSSLKEIEKEESIVEEATSDSRTLGEEGEIVAAIDEILNHSAANTRFNEELIVYSNVNKNDNLVNDASSNNVPIESNEFSGGVKSGVLSPERYIDSSQEKKMTEQTLIHDQLSLTSSLSNDENAKDRKDVNSQIDSCVKDEEKTLPNYDSCISDEYGVFHKNENSEEGGNRAEEADEIGVISNGICSLDHACTTESIEPDEFPKRKTEAENEEDYTIDGKLDHNYWKTLIYLSIMAFTILAFTLGYYYIENIRRDGQLIARINKLEKELLVSTKECEALSENLRFTKEKLYSIEDESFGSNEMVVSLKVDLEASQNAKVELEDQVAMLEKDLENATEAGLELERMLREVLSSNDEVNPLAQSVEDLQARLDAQQAANESLTNALNLKAQEIETLSVDFASVKKKCEELKVELSRVEDESAIQSNLKSNIEQTLTDKIHRLEMQISELSAEKLSLHKELRGKEVEIKEFAEVISQVNSNNLDLDKLYDVSRVKTEVVQLREERDELKTRLSDVEGAHQLLEEHMKLIKEEIAALSDQCQIAEKEKKDAETRLEVLSNFFKEKEIERQREEAVWLQKQGEVVSTVEKIHTMQNEVQNYKQQVEILKREIVDQEREYKNQISILETKAHEQWVTARQNERRLKESKAEAGQLRNRLTLVEKNLNDSDSEAKLHRLETNGETTISPSLFIGAESSGSPVMFSRSSGVPPPPPPYLHCFPPYLPPLPPAASVLPPYDISQRPPPLGGRLSSPPPPPMPPLHPSASGGRYENAGSPPPPMSPHLLPPFIRHRSPPPPPLFSGDHIPPPLPPGTTLPPPIGTAHPWGEESSLPLLRNSNYHSHQREQRARNHKGSLHSSRESLDKVHHGKV